jgi:hypothetical protein
MLVVTGQFERAEPLALELCATIATAKTSYSCARLTTIALVSRRLIGTIDPRALAGGQLGLVYPYPLFPP